MSDVKVETRAGVVVEIAGQTMVCPPLSCGAIRDLTRGGVFAAIHAAQVASVDGTKVTPEQEADLLDAWIAILSAALVPHDPTCTRAWVASLPLTLLDLGRVVASILKASGFGAGEGNDSPRHEAPDR